MAAGTLGVALLGDWGLDQCRAHSGRRGFFKNERISIVKSICSKVGRSVWEFKIDPERLREEIKSIIETRRTNIGDKKSIKDHVERGALFRKPNLRSRSGYQIVPNRL